MFSLVLREQEEKKQIFCTTDLPRAAKLCLSLCSIRKRKNGGEEVTMLYWGNLNVFDYKHRLALTGTLYLYLRPAPKEMEELLYPIGASGETRTK